MELNLVVIHKLHGGGHDVCDVAQELHLQYDSRPHIVGKR